MHLCIYLLKHYFLHMRKFAFIATSVCEILLQFGCIKRRIDEQTQMRLRKCGFNCKHALLC